MTLYLLAPTSHLGMVQGDKVGGRYLIVWGTWGLCSMSVTTLFSVRRCWARLERMWRGVYGRAGYLVTFSVMIRNSKRQR